MKKANICLDDYVTIIATAKEKNNLSEEAKLILWGSMLEAAGYGKITLADVNYLENLMQLDTKKYWKALEIATLGEEQSA
jgi:hypothetical protein